MGAFAQHDTCAVLAPVAGDHLRARLAARMDRNHHHLRAYLPADVEALQHRPDPVGDAGVREFAGGVPVAAGRDVGVLSEGRRAETRHAQPDLCRHDALHADRHRLHGHHVSVARHDAVAAELSVWGLRGGVSLRRPQPLACAVVLATDARLDTGLTQAEGRHAAIDCLVIAGMYPIGFVPDADIAARL